MVNFLGGRVNTLDYFVLGGNLIGTRIMNSLFRMNTWVIKSLFEKEIMMEKFIPVVVIKVLAETDRILTALKHNNINCAEITFRTACAADAIAYAVANYPDMEIGAGTVINADQCEAALKAGATFIVSPGLSPSVAKICNERNVPYYPGCVTPTEIMAALELGITTVKFFPANIYGGLKALKALSAPFPQVKFIPTGGVDRSNIDEFLAFDKVAAIGGSFFVKESLEKMEADQ